MSRRFTAPRRGVASPPGQELLGVITSHGPFRECCTPAQKIKRLPGRRAGHVSRVNDIVCSRGVSTVFIRGRRASAIAAPSVGGGRGSGRGGRHSRSTGRRGVASSGATAKAGAIASA